MNFKQDVIRDIAQLHLRPPAMELAKELLHQTDMPVVFWIDAPTDLNYRSRHGELQNEYWVPIKPQSFQSEFERLVLGGIYNCILEGKRVLRVWPRTEYANSLQIEQRKQKYFRLVRMLNSVVYSLDTECFLQPYGISTNASVLQTKLSRMLQLLEEYKQKRKEQPPFRWYQETRVCNLIEIANLCRRGYSFRKPLLSKLKSVQSADLQLVQRVENLFADYTGNYSSEQNDKQDEILLRGLIKLFSMDSMLRLYRPFSMAGQFQFMDGSLANVYSFLPEDWQGQDSLRRWLRNAGMLISGIRGLEGYELPDAVLQLVQTHRINAFSNLIDGTYCISFSTGLVEKATELAFARCPEPAGAEQLLRIIAFVATAHEYGHIVNGDCEKQANTGEEDRPEKERKADDFAIEMVSKVIPLQYRTTVKTEDQMDLFHEYWSKGEKDKIEQLINEIPAGRKLEIDAEVQVLQGKILSDLRLLKAAFQIVQSLRREGAIEDNELNSRGKIAL